MLLVWYKYDTGCPPGFGEKWKMELSKKVGCEGCLSLLLLVC